MAKTKTPAGADLTYLPVEQLKIHPKNLRRYYPEADVQQMADSIKAVGGVVQALQIVPTGQFTDVDGDKLPLFYVVDGNMRLSAARTIENCPPLKCEQISSSAAEQLLLMAVTSEFHYPKDPISKALHYKRLVEDEGLTPPQIAELTGLSQSSIYNAIRLLEITDEPTRQLIGQRKLPPDIALHRHLAQIPDPEKRLELAKRFAARGMSAKSALKSTRYVLRQYQALPDKPNPKAPALKIVSKNGSGKTSKPLDADKVTQIARLHLCPGCRLDGLQQKCYTCPGPYEFINHLVDLLPVEAQAAAVGEEVPA